MSQERDGGAGINFMERRLLDVLFLAYQNLGTFEITVKNEIKSRCLCGMYIPALCATLSGVVRGVVVIQSTQVS